ncbi:hypothetical protein HD554DRAFT_1819904 [Boletus coccyginus]|nr:hypothetical protein HD554DRAFT_1819904 [Boletus coccyginus]
MRDELPEDAGVNDERAGWELDFKARCIKELEQSGDVASGLCVIRRCCCPLLYGADPRSFIDSLEDADAAIKLDPSSLSGHERKHAALLGARRYAEAIDAYNDMLLMLERSPDPVTRELRKDYVSPSQTKAAIRNAVKRTQRDVPLVVIDTKTGCLCDQRERMDEFEADPKFVELVASMTTRT